jgi:hexokinase
LRHFKPDVTPGSGGTNLRVGFIELLGPTGSPLSDSKAAGDEDAQSGIKLRVRRLLEKSWPIGERLKRTRAEDLFEWIGKCVVGVVRDGLEAWPGELPDPVPMGVTFSFPILFVSPFSFNYGS